MTKKEPLKPDKMKFYFHHTKDGLPRVTVCLAMIKGTIARGVSLCSFQENNCVKRHGKFIARNRALRALLGRVNEKDTIRRPEAIDVMSDAGIYFVEKSILNPILDGREQGLLGIP